MRCCPPSVPTSPYSISSSTSGGRATRRPWLGCGASATTLTIFIGGETREYVWRLATCSRSCCAGAWFASGQCPLCACGPTRHGVETETLPCVRRHCRLCDDSHCLCCGLNGVVLVGVGVRGYVATDFKTKAYAYNESVCINMYMYPLTVSCTLRVVRVCAW